MIDLALREHALRPAGHLVARRRNPFYLASAVSMLAGCLAIQDGLALAPGHVRGLLLLAGVLQAYEALLLLLSVVLARAQGPGFDVRTLLALEAGFLLDATFLGAELATADPGVGLRTGAALTLAAGIKLVLLNDALRLAVPRRRAILGAALGVLVLVLPAACAALVGSLHVDGLLAFALWALIGLLPALDAAASAPAPADPLARWVHGLVRWAPLVSLGLHVVALHWTHRLPVDLCLLSMACVGIAGRRLLLRGDRVPLLLPALALLLSLSAPHDLAGWSGPWSAFRLVLVALAGLWALTALCGRPLAWGLSAASLFVAALGSNPDHVAMRVVAVMHRSASQVGVFVPSSSAAWGMAAVLLAFVLLGAGVAWSMYPPPARVVSRGDMWEAWRQVPAGSVAATIVFLSVVWAIATPSLLRARISANESATIGWLRTVVSAEAAYATAHEGRFAPVSCLARPCRAGDLVYLDQSQLPATRSGYQLAFYGGPAAGVGGDVLSYTLEAVPVSRNESGVRSFAASSDGRICAAPEPIPGAKAGGRLDCRELR